MMPEPISAAVSLLCGLGAGLAVGVLLRRRAQEAHDGPWALPARPVRVPLWFHALLLGVASAALSLLPGLRDPVALSQALLLLYVLYALAGVDLLTLTIEPALVVGGMLLRMGAVLALRPAQALEMTGGLLGGAGLLTVVGFAYQWLRGREGLGEGDALVLGLVGAFVGWGGILPVVLLATVAGLLVGVPALLLLRKPLHTPLPFAPFLCLGGLGVFVAQAHGLSLFGLLPPLG